ncbi:ABC transporter permease [Natronobacterium texcoconense]|uniref:ABC-2 family transporter protein n=1 Tax=Natronobacterium texcoconense TaxID=1095778 RepID=A0A1H1FK28_NATTX|nr:hypothetical protein [Natronobacterium texcoconense]SDR01392.1 ABC-2 family transporter protein [Natronobacterium texcoconense]
MKVGRSSWRPIFHVARADFRQRIRSRKVLVVLAVIAYLGYLVNVGTVEIFYVDSSDGGTVQYTGEPTSAYIGLTAGMTGASVLLFLGYYLLAGSLERDRTTDVDRLVASTGISTRTLLLGKWLSHVGYVAVVLGTLGIAAVINHLVHGTGTTDPVWILGTVFLLGMPVGCLVAGVTLLFQSTDWLDGTIGNVVYFFTAMTALIVALATADYAPDEIPVWLQLTDTVGMFVSAELTAEALYSVAPEYDGLGVANFGAGSASAEIVRFHWDGDWLPLWFYANRFGLILLGIGFAALATVPYERFERDGSTNSDGTVCRLLRVLPSIRSTATGQTSDIRSVENAALTPVTDRTAGGIGRLVVQELRLLVRGQPWWWYAGALVIGIAGLTGSAASTGLVVVAAIWPLFLWSSMGSRAVRHRITPFIVSSKQPYGQLVAEWLAGAIVATAFFGVSLWPLIVEAGASGAVVLVGAVLFVPSLAQAMGYWTGTRRLFELTYLLLWYVGPLNEVPVLDFAGATSATAGTTTPLLFGGIGLAALVTAFVHRYRQT